MIVPKCHRRQVRSSASSVGHANSLRTFESRTVVCKRTIVFGLGIEPTSRRLQSVLRYAIGDFNLRTCQHPEAVSQYRTVTHRPDVNRVITYAPPLSSQR